MQDPVEAAECLNAALETGSEELILLAFKNVVEAQGHKVHPDNEYLTIKML